MRKNIVKYLTIFFIVFIGVTLGTNFLINSFLAPFKEPGREVTLKGLFSFSPSKNQIYLRMLIAVPIFFMIISKITEKAKTKKKLNFGQYGDSRFSTLKEIKSQYKEIDATRKSYSHEGGTIVARYKGKLYIDDDTVNTIVLGMTRSGKGELYVLPMIDVLSRSIKKPSLVINDMKGELVTAAADRLKERGYDVHIFNLLDPSRSMQVNLLDPIAEQWNKGNKDEAQLMVRSITHTIFPSEEMGDDVYWREGAVSLVNGFILGCLTIFQGNRDKLTLPHVALHMQHVSTQIDGFDNFFALLPKEDPGRVEASTFLSGGEKQRSSFLSIASSKLRNFTMEKFQMMMSRSTLDFSMIGFSDRPQAIFLVIPDYDSSNHYLASLIVKQIYDANIKKASSEKGQKTRRRIHFLFDEFGNMPAIADMGSTVTAGLSRGMIFHLILQDFEQLKKRYPSDASTIKSNCGNLLYILSKDPDSLKYISDACGFITTETFSGGQDGENITMSVIERPLISIDELQTLKLWETIFIRSSKRVDCKGKPIIPYPIDNRKKTKLKPRFEYLSEDFPLGHVSLSEITDKYYPRYEPQQGPKYEKEEHLLDKMEYQSKKPRGTINF